MKISLSWAEVGMLKAHLKDISEACEYPPDQATARRLLAKIREAEEIEASKARAWRKEEGRTE